MNSIIHYPSQQVPNYIWPISQLEQKNKVDSTAKKTNDVDENWTRDLPLDRPPHMRNARDTSINSMPVMRFIICLNWTVSMYIFLSRCSLVVPVQIACVYECCYVYFNSIHTQYTHTISVVFFSVFSVFFVLSVRWWRMGEWEMEIKWKSHIIFDYFACISLWL